MLFFSFLEIGALAADCSVLEEIRSSKCHCVLQGGCLCHSHLHPVFFSPRLRLQRSGLPFSPQRLQAWAQSLPSLILDWDTVSPNCSLLPGLFHFKNAIINHFGELQKTSTEKLQSTWRSYRSGLRAVVPASFRHGNSKVKLPVISRIMPPPQRCPY